MHLLNRCTTHLNSVAGKGVSGLTATEKDLTGADDPNSTQGRKNVILIWFLVFSCMGACVSVCVAKE